MKRLNSFSVNKYLQQGDLEQRRLASPSSHSGTFSGYLPLFVEISEVTVEYIKCVFSWAGLHTQDAFLPPAFNFPLQLLQVWKTCGAKQVKAHDLLVWMIGLVLTSFIHGEARSFSSLYTSCRVLKLMKISMGSQRKALRMSLMCSNYLVPMRICAIAHKHVPCEY